MILKRYKKNIPIQELLGQSSSKTTEIYTDVSKKAISKIRNPIDDYFEKTDKRVK